MNICFLTNIDELGGGELWVLKACRYLKSQGHSVSVLCSYQSKLYDAAVRAGLDIFAFELKDGSPFYSPLYHFLRKRRIDVVYCTLVGKFWEAKVLQDVADEINRERSSGRLFVVLKTGLPPAAGGDPASYGVGVGPAIRRLHVVCESTRKAFYRWEPRLPREFVEVFYEGIDLTEFDPARYDRDGCRARWQFSPRQTVITCLARLHVAKGQDDLLLAAHEIHKTQPDARFVFAGEGEDRARLEQLADHLQLNGAVRFLGQVDDVPSLVAASDIICHPSRNDSLPNALVEAMAMRKPVIASELEGIPEIVEHGRSGLLISPHDVQGLVSALSTLLGDRHEADRLAAAARSRIEQGFDLSRNLNRLAARLEEEQAAFDMAPLAAVTAPLRFEGPIPILFIMTALRTGGEETELAILARYLDRRRFRLHVLSCWPVDEPSPAVERLQSLGFAVDTACHGIDSAEGKVRHIIEKIRHNRIRLVVACQDTAIAYYVFQNLAAGECRLIEHGGISHEAQRIPKEFTARYIGVSPAIRNAAAGLMKDDANAVVIPSMVDTSEYSGFDRSTLRAAYGIPSDACVVTFVGRLDPKKRIEDIIGAAAKILPRVGNAWFLLVGPPDGLAPDYAQQMVELARPLAGSQRFFMTGGRTDVPQILAASDIFILPGTGEGMSHAINEAGAAGLAVIAADDGAAREQLEAGRYGRLIPPGSPQELTSAIIELIADPVLRRALGTGLQGKVLREYSHEVLVPRWESILSETVAEIPGPEFQPLPGIKKDELLRFPREIQIQTNTLCNATCVMCPYPEVAKEFDRGTMDQELYEEILRQCSTEPGLRRIEPFLMNEPFTDRRLVDWIAMAKKKVPHAMVTVTTNGTLVRPAVTDRLIQSGLDAIWFSFNGATKETFESIMGCSYDTVVANIDYLLSMRPPTLHVFTNMIETTRMLPEIEENIRGWTSRGVGSGSSKLVNRAGNVRNFAELNYRPIHSDPVRLCDLLFHKMYILYNGDVVLCCMDWRRNVIMGNVRQQSLLDIWHGEKYMHYRRMHEEGRSRELDLCATCSYVYN